MLVTVYNTTGVTAHKWQIAPSDDMPRCQPQMNYIVQSCSVNKLADDHFLRLGLHSADDNAATWYET